jgi:2-desacetyl-2-hydroxyethyl bacteriochlorophyllide A dehydrogenase
VTLSRAAIFDGPHRLRLITRELPDVGPGEALVEVRWVGICGSDVDLRNGTRPADAVRYPVVPGHEWSGVVEAVGEGVDPTWLRRPVVGENIRSCGECEPCRDGDVANCGGVYEEAGFTIDGAWADRILVPVTHLHMLPDHTSLRSAAGIEPAACAATAVSEARINSHHVVGVVGGGTIGLLCVQLISARGANVTVVDPHSWKQPIAMRCGAATFVDPESARTSTGRFDIVIEAAGTFDSAQLAFDLARRGGRVVLCGIAPSNDVVRTVDIVSKNLTVTGIFGATKAGWEQAVASFVAGDLDPVVLVTHEFSLDEIERALNVVESAGPMVGKVLIRP